MNKKIILTLTVLCSYGLVHADPFTVVRRANRRFNAELVRNGTADRCVRQDLAAQPTNGDEQLYEDLRGNFGKGLKQITNDTDSSLVDPEAYNSLLFALATGNSSDFDKIQMHLTPAQRKLVTPQAGLDFNLAGPDSWIHSIIAPPAIASAEKAGEMVEVYEIALLRDFNLSYTAPISFTAQNAINALNALSDFKGPKEGGVVTPQTLFRSNIPGATTGNYISQFLLQNVSFSDTSFLQQYMVQAKNINYLTTRTGWVDSQKGINVTAVAPSVGPRYIITPRDLASFVHNDAGQLPYIFALLILLSWADTDPMNVFDANNPYLGTNSQQAFAEFYTKQLISLIGMACDMAIRAAWYQKWFVHRTIRPEYFAWLVDRAKTGTPGFTGILHNDVLNSAVTAANPAGGSINTFNTNAGEDNWLLPQAYVEGCPLHPTYPAGHATTAGASVTILKAFFNEDHPFPQTAVTCQAMQPNDDGSALTPYAGDPITIGGELNKLAANIAYGRNFAGIHYRSDAEESMRLGEKIAISLLEDWAYTMNIDFKGFSLTKFDGTKITVGTKKVMAGLPR